MVLCTRSLQIYPVPPSVVLVMFGLDFSRQKDPLIKALVMSCANLKDLQENVSHDGRKPATISNILAWRTQKYYSAVNGVGITTDLNDILIT